MTECVSDGIWVANEDGPKDMTIGVCDEDIEGFDDINNNGAIETASDGIWVSNVDEIDDLIIEGIDDSEFEGFDDIPDVGKFDRSDGVIETASDGIWVSNGDGNLVIAMDDVTEVFDENNVEGKSEGCLLSTFDGASDKCLDDLGEGVGKILNTSEAIMKAKSSA